MEFNIVKAGSVQRLSTVLKRWKPAWLVVYGNGNFAYFETENDHEPKSLIHLPTQCVRIISKLQHQDPPSGRKKDCLFGFSIRESDWIFCAESADDAHSWCVALTEARNAARPVYIPSAAACGGYSDGSNYYQHLAYPHTFVPIYDPQRHTGIPTVPTVYRGTDGELVVPQQVIEHADGTRTVVFGQGNRVLCRCRRGHYCGCGYGYADGALLGLAASTMMWSPFLWAPFFWC